jgi:cytochrome c553
MIPRIGFLCAAITLVLPPFAAAATRLAPPKSLSVQLPDGTEAFPGPDADAINQNCLGCHSADMVTNQPAMTKPAWQAEVAKMIAAYKAPIAAQDIDAITAYLYRTRGLN